MSLLCPRNVTGTVWKLKVEQKEKKQKNAINEIEFNIITGKKRLLKVEL